MKRINILLCMALLSAILNSCRQDDDYVASYAGSDYLSSYSSGVNYSSQFDALWTAINSNYVAWELETVNWDDVKAKYAPRFAEFDTLVAHKEEVTDSMFKAIYHEVLDTLHDGHAYYYLKNLSTSKYAAFSPQSERNARLYGKAMSKSVPFDLDYYASDNIPEAERFVEYRQANSSCRKYLQKNLEEGIACLDAAMSRAETEEEFAELMWQKEELEGFVNAMRDAPSYAEQVIITQYNKIAAQMHDARMPQYVTNLGGTNVQLISGVTSDGIAYIRLSDFQFTNFLSATDEDVEEMRKRGLEDDAEIYDDIYYTWELWYSSIQELSASGGLKGVIIDVRDNGGGRNSDQAFFLGALLPSGGHKVGTFKTKIGTGRLDYSVSMDFKINTMESEHAVIDNVPIVALCNHRSVSNSEMACIAIKQLPNGEVVGTQTFGGMSSLIPGSDYYSLTYGGEFGVEGETPIYGYQPITLISYDGFGPLEGKGVTPSEGYNIEYDPDYRSTAINPATGKPYQLDNQFEAALRCIRSK